MIVRNSGLSILTTVLALATAACTSSSSPDHDKPIEPKSLVGSWEVTAVRVNAKTTKAYLHSAQADGVGYHSTENWQYKFDDNSVTMMISDEVGLKYQMSSPYQIRGNRMIPTPTDSKSAANLMGMTIVGMAADHFEAILDMSNGSNQHFILTKIKEEDLATNKLKPIAHNLSVKFISDEKVLGEQSFTGAFRDDRAEEVIACRVNRRGDIDKNNKPIVRDTFGISAFRHPKNDDGSISYDYDGDGPHIDVNFPVKFDFSKSDESVQSDLNVEQTIDAVLKKDEGTPAMYISTLDATICTIDIKRTDRTVDYTATCSPIAAMAPNTKNVPGSLEIKGTCALDF